MGVPYYFRKIWEDYPEVILQLLDNVYDLYFDFNGIAHWAAGKVAEERKYNPKHHDAYEDAILNKIDERVEQIFQLVKPSQLIGFFVDGPAVKGKMKQQLQRRSKGPFESNVRKVIEDVMDGKIDVPENLPRDTDIFDFYFKMAWNYKPNEPSYDRGNITPGTPFMAKLNKHIRKLANKYNHLQIIISDSNDPGEGEHKLFNYMKRHRKSPPGETQNKVIVGLDADLIMLSLVSHFNDIYLLRESTDRDVKDSDNIFNYLDVPFFKQLLVSEIRNEITSVDQQALYQAEEGNSIIDDYIFMCFMLGNDFVPHSPCLSIRHEGIQKLIKHYVTVFNDTEEHLVTIKNKNDPDKITATVNYEPVKRLIELLAEDENFEMQNTYANRRKLARRPPLNRNPKHTPLDDELHKFHFLPAFRVEKELKLKIDGFHGWKQKYFRHVIGRKRTIENIETICKNYLEGLDWNLQYYYTESHSWGWMYQFVGAPLFQDLAIYLNKRNEYPIELTSEKRMIPYTPYCQLMMVLPKSSAELLPKVLEKLMKDDKSVVGKYYPNTFQLMFYFHVCFWETEPIIPLVDEKQIELIVSSANLSKEEIERNSFSELQIIKAKL